MFPNFRRFASYIRSFFNHGVQAKAEKVESYVHYGTFDEPRVSKEEALAFNSAREIRRVIFKMVKASAIRKYHDLEDGSCKGSEDVLKKLGELQAIHNVCKTILKDVDMSQYEQ